MKWAVAFVAVLLSPSIAKRLENEQPSSELQTGESASLFSADVVAAFEEVAADEEEQTQQMCTRFSAMQNRSYHFELVYPDGERTAMELERHPRDPKLRLYRGRTWSVQLVRTPDRFSGEIQESLAWTPVQHNDQGEPRVDEHGNMIVDYSAPMEIDVRKDLAYIRRVRGTGEEGNGIELGFMNGHNHRFAGGLYYPDNAMKRSLVRAFREREAEVRAQRLPSERGEVSTMARHAEDREMTVGGGRIAVDGVLSIGEQLYSNAKVSAVLAFVTSFFPLIGANPWAIGMAWSATVTGVWHGTVWALPIIIPTSIWSSIHSWRHERRELSMSASEKLFEKFSCHRMIGLCDGADLVGREPVSVFTGRPDSDTLVPIQGDVDVVTRQPFPPVVSWGELIQNPGNIECIDRRIWGH